MNAMVLLLVASVALVLGYALYGKWLAKQWGLDPSRTTPAYEMADGVDYVAAPSYVVLGHHFSSIAGAGPINGPIQAAVFGWLPVALWVIIGGIFFGAMHDFGALFASVRHKGQTLAIVVRDNIDGTAKTLFAIFAYSTLVLISAAFASIVSGTFGVTGVDPVADERNMTTASISIVYIVVAIVWGFIFRGRKIPGASNIALAIVALIVCVTVGMGFHPLALAPQTWIWILAGYILVASLAPVWILLQPRDYLSSYLLYGMIILSFIGIVGAGILGRADMDIPLFSGWAVDNAAVDASGAPIVGPDGAAVVNSSASVGPLFPVLFVTIACGAISGFHSLVASGTTSKQIDNESHARIIGYGGMLIESLLAIISLCAVGFAWASYRAGDFATPTQVFASGLSNVLTSVFGEEARSISYQLLILAASAFCLTSLDTSTRLARYMFQEMWVPKGETIDTVSGWRAVLANRYVATLVTVAFAIGLGMTGYSVIWPLFGAANQLLAALALLAVAAWLGNCGRNNKMFVPPMVFMLLVALTSLAMTIWQKVGLFANGSFLDQPGGAIGVAVQLAISLMLFVLAIVLAVRGVRTMRSSGARKDKAA
ncbi:MAG: carbon starvation protein A [Eggerthellaceae bacterium]|nr:carbon starvation protein A [Eggerthellaceae bacterium]